MVGDALAALLEKVGYAVTREYYVNDAGAQVDVLARSAYLRYREALGEDIGEIPEGYYPGDYLKQVGQDLAARDGDKWLKAEESEWLAPIRAFAIEAMMDLVRADLKDLGRRAERLHLGAWPGRGRAGRGGLQDPGGSGPDLHRHPGAAQGQAGRGLGAGAADPLQGHPIWG